ncbi:atypical kinase COQ8B, mitochondrial-like [Anneissia japonica]|uniref:atypical kinase COQ8B, mitochondrial-like n=1 Tax=Anneissia japonica TaxID=1529436 RepID=UPI0014254BD8|nr:atypical kinase COQ8B, mitochondrial-like [Anneissia japonica]XP_033127888.1 atypical kinase COQ8B, mitochondrial-like [Anneissia japonica]
MAQSRLADIGKITKGFGLVAKAFFEMGGKEVERRLNNSSLKPVVSTVQSKFEDCMEYIPKEEFYQMDFTSQDFDIMNADDWEPVGVGIDENIRPKTSNENHTQTSRRAEVRTQKTGENDVHTQTTQTTPGSNGFPPKRSYHTWSAFNTKFIFVAHRNRVRHCTTGFAAEDIKKFTKGQPPRKTRNKQVLSDRAKERTVPSTRLGRVLSFGELAAGLGIGTIAELARRGLGLTNDSDNNGRSALLTTANADRVVSTLCKVRGAALKLGQMLSIQDNSLISPELQNVFERVRQSADFMPVRQMTGVLKKELGDDWRSKVASFEEKPFAAASIGQVHLATLHDGKEVAMKIQYPGVAKGIDSDIENLTAILNIWNVLPEGMYIENAMDVARRELSWEIDYIREAKYSELFRNLLKSDVIFTVPAVVHELSSKEVLTTELIDGIPLDKAIDLDQETRNMISLNILRLCLTEIFEWFVMQTDPNWSNFFYNADSKKIWLLDFGATRVFDKSFVDKYIRIIHGARTGDRQAVLEYSQRLGFLTGYESKVMEEAHVEAVMILGEAFQSDQPFNFATQDTTMRIHSLMSRMLHHRLTPPPEESYSLHRKMAGAFLLCTKLGANISCKPLFDKHWQRYEFDDE